MKRNFVTSLTRKSITNTVKKLENYKNNTLQQKAEIIASSLADTGVYVAQLMVAKYDAIFTTELISSIEKKFGGYTKDKCVFYVVADSKHAVFVEFGTGQMGLEAPYPYPMPAGFDREYNTGKTIFEVSPGQYGWFYRRDGETYFTQGMPSRPFMYETAQELANRVVRIVKAAFKY